MSTAKEIVRGIIAIILAVMMFYFWGNVRADDPEYFKYGAAIIVGIMSFAVLHFIGKEN